MNRPESHATTTSRAQLAPETMWHQAALARELDYPAFHPVTPVPGNAQMGQDMSCDSLSTSTTAHPTRCAGQGQVAAGQEVRGTDLSRNVTG
jgi:hypothetical protein